MLLQIKDYKRNHDMKIILDLIETHSNHINKISPAFGQTRMFLPTIHLTCRRDWTCRRKRLITILKLQPISLTTNQHFVVQQQYTYNTYISSTQRFVLQRSQYWLTPHSCQIIGCNKPKILFEFRHEIKGWFLRKIFISDFYVDFNPLD